MLGKTNFGEFQDGTEGMIVTAGSTSTNVKVQAGFARIAAKGFVQEQAAIADIAVSTVNGVYTLYLNVPGAIGTDASTLTRFGFIAEADKTRPTINGSTSVTAGRSIPLATITVAGNVVSVIDNSIRLAPQGAGSPYSTRNNAG